MLRKIDFCVCDGGAGSSRFSYVRCIQMSCFFSGREEEFFFVLVICVELSMNPCHRPPPRLHQRGLLENVECGRERTFQSSSHRSQKTVGSPHQLPVPPAAAPSSDVPLRCLRDPHRFGNGSRSGLRGCLLQRRKRFARQTPSRSARGVGASLPLLCRSDEVAGHLHGLHRMPAQHRCGAHHVLYRLLDGGCTSRRWTGKVGPRTMGAAIRKQSGFAVERKSEAPNHVLERWGEPPLRCH